MRKNLVAMLSGVLFGVGLVLSGMTQPQKVVGFLDLFGDWDPSLIFVMCGAILVYSIGFYFSKKMRAPFASNQFHLPTTKIIDGKLIVGAVFFGVGWGLAGYCPGPALTSLVTLDSKIILFVVAMAAGMYLHSWLNLMIEKEI